MFSPTIDIDDGIRYILEELALLEGCCSHGLGFEDIDARQAHESQAKESSQNQPQPLFIVYPGEEEQAFIEARKQFRNPKPYFNNQWLPISLSEVNHSNQIAYFSRQEQIKNVIEP